MFDHVHRHVIPAALSLLPPRMTSLGAKALLLAIGLQESRFLYRAQVRGPARGFWQFESNGVRGVLGHRASQQHAIAASTSLIYDPGVPRVMTAIEHNDTLAAVFARLLLWTHPRALPAVEETEQAWEYYLQLWRPGKPHEGTWANHYEAAWAAVLAA